MNHSVTVSIPYFRCKAEVRKAVESVLGQTHTDLTVVVVNDGDQDAPWDQLQHIHDPRLVRFELDSNRGRYFADAVVLRATTSPYFLVHDADDWSEPNRVSVLLEHLQSRSADGAISACCLYRMEDGALGRVHRSSFRAVERTLTREFCHRANHHGLFRSQALRDVGGFFGGFRIGYDTLLVNLLLMAGRVVYVDECLYNMLLRPGSLTHCASTGKGSPARRTVAAQLEEMYDEAFRWYSQYRAGEIKRNALLVQIQHICGRQIAPADQSALVQASDRLRPLLKAATESAQSRSPARGAVQAPRVTAARESVPAHTSAPTADHLMDDPRVPWSAWTISKRLALELTRHLEETRPRRILEVGSGTSTAFLASYAALNGAVVVSLEHDGQFHERTRQLLEQLGLADPVELELAPLLSTCLVDGMNYPWYQTQIEGSFDFVFVDGPPIRHGRQAVLFALSGHLAANWELWLKDGRREHETACVELWSQHFRFSSTLTDADPRGVWILRGESPKKPGRPGAGNSTRPTTTELARDAEIRIDQFLSDGRLPWTAWTIPKQLACQLVRHLAEKNPSRVLEVGSGISTVLLADHAARNGAEVVSLEHDSRYYEKTRRLLAQFGLEDHVDLQLAPLVPTSFVDGLRFPWYQVQLAGEFDFVFADGPPLRYGRQAILFAVSEHLKENWELWLDDGKRGHEMACVELWTDHFDFMRELVDIEPKGYWSLCNRHQPLHEGVV